MTDKPSIHRNKVSIESKNTIPAELSQMGEYFGISNPVTLRKLKREHKKVKWTSTVFSFLLASILGLQVAHIAWVKLHESRDEDEGKTESK